MNAWEQSLQSEAKYMPFFQDYLDFENVALKDFEPHKSNFICKEDLGTLDLSRTQVRKKCIHIQSKMQLLST